jgi:hypothetical protein
MVKIRAVRDADFKIVSGYITHYFFYRKLIALPINTETKKRCLHF